MQVITQSLEEVLKSLQVLEVDWQDDVARRVIVRLHDLPVKGAYTAEDIRSILDTGKFPDSQIMIRLFLGQSKDQFESRLAF